MGKTFRRDGSFRPKGKDFKKFKKSNKLKKWDKKPQHTLQSDKAPDIEESIE